MNLQLLHVGLGPLGLCIQADLLSRGLARTRAAVDPVHAGRKLSELVSGAGDVTILSSLEELPAGERFDAALVTTSSDLAACAATFRALLGRGISVVSTCEELVWPWLRHPSLARELAELAQRRGARLLGTGVNPGFLMDALPVFASAVCADVRGVLIQRIQDASPRRIPFQKKIGAGLDRAAFQRAVEAGKLRHVGLGESLHFVAHSLGFEVERWNETIEPVLAERELDSALGRIAQGAAAGVRQVAEGTARGGAKLRLEFQAAIGQADPHDRVALDSAPRIDLVLRGGVHGDVATSAIALNALAPLLDAPPGLHTMATIRPVCCHDAGTRRRG
jgi:4-hydroxy-tetrahydrodipicolinate reductase